MDLEQAKSKIAKLMAMADTNSGATQNEMETALRQAEKMMLKFGISLLDVQQSNNKPYQFSWDTGFYPFGREGKGTQSNPVWFQWLAVSVANFTDTIVVQAMRREGYGVEFKGNDEDVAFALWLIAYLKDNLRKATREADLGSSAGRETFRRSMATRLGGRMRELRQQRSVQLSSCNALVVVDRKIAERDCHFGGPKYKTGKSRTQMGSYIGDAAAKGRAAAERVNFNRPIESTRSAGQIK